MTPPGSVQRLSVKPKTPGQRGLPKRAVPRLRVTPAGAEGDYNHYRTTKVAGNPDLAILVLTREVIDALRSEGWPVEPGDLGENLTLDGVRESSLKPGSRIRIGEVLLEVSEPCDPCTEVYVLPYVGQDKGPAFVRALVGRRGWFTRVLTEGEVLPGAPVEVIPA
ncbi:MAG TPA: MOSC domain-containing protein [Gemmatimonadales bacterium]|jgi:MOSC domain-containing protein YiiM|nr:MOSC domain-containing protein [Gemmatimonadales bacterium]